MNATQEHRMPRRFVFTPTMRARIVRLLAHRSFPAIAVAVGCDVTTLKRYLVREGLIETETAKYLPAIKVAVWTRPCICCGDQKPRPKNLYMCDACRAQSSGMA
jgi:hypothetical protein